MFAVVVLLTKPRAHTIVPENYIYGLKELEDNLKTWGANKKHDHLIFWSQNLLNDDTVPDETIQPNFSSASYDVFPPPPQVKAACYIGRIKRFFSKNKIIIYIRELHLLHCLKICMFIMIESFDAAKQYCNRFRPVLPVPYNPNILNNQPTPPNNVDGQNIENEQENEQENDANSENSGNDNEVGESDEPISENDQEIGLESAENDHQSSDAEQKFVLAPVNLDQSDIIALDSLFDIEDFSSDGENLAVGGFESLDNTTHQNPPQFEAEDNGSAINENQTNEMNSNHSNNQIIDTTNSQEPNNDDTTNGEADENVSNEEINILLRSYKPAENEKVALTQDGRIAITKAIDDELEMTFVLGEQLLPIEDRFQIKMNDALSGNMPFQENVHIKHDNILIFTAKTTTFIFRNKRIVRI